MIIQQMLEVCHTKSLSFDELIPGNSVRVTFDNLIYAVDLTMVITEKNRNEACTFLCVFLINHILIQSWLLVKLVKHE
jgi:hypothetical protein